MKPVECCHMGDDILCLDNVVPRYLLSKSLLDPCNIPIIDNPITV
ncbi:hypothetical protein HanIR_Chr04g0183321 [Helianthus annuus]|nr:hypothetical protein HanIR_Chr04g0183321 [Helianthus annuus]